MIVDAVKESDQSRADRCIQELLDDAKGIWRCSRHRLRSDHKKLGDLSTKIPLSLDPLDTIINDPDID